MTVEYTKSELLAALNDTIGVLQATRGAVEGLNDADMGHVCRGPSPIIAQGFCENVANVELLQDYLLQLAGLHRAIDRLRRYGGVVPPPL